MRSTIIAGALAFAISNVAAQSSYYSNQSAPFFLQISSHNKTLDGQTLNPCHEGAAIEGLCLGGALTSESYTYNFNYSADAVADPVTGIIGLLTWELRGSNFNLSSPMALACMSSNPSSSPTLPVTFTNTFPPDNPTSNVAVPLFEPAETGTSVGFDSSNKLFIPQYIDDTVIPANYSTERVYRWRVCQTTSGYTYDTLAWVMGIHKAENPSCQKVNVVRVFA